MAFSESQIITVPLGDPKIKFGRTFRVSEIYLTNTPTSPTAYILPSGSDEASVFEQNFENNILDLKWNVIDPKNGKIYSTERDIVQNPYISGFDVSIYKNAQGATGINVTESGVREKVFEVKGLRDTSLNYEISGDFWRNYSVDVALSDFDGNRATGILVTQNPKPVCIITGTGVKEGYFYTLYNYTESDFRTLNLYNFSGLSGLGFSQNADYVSKAQRISKGANGAVRIELTPGEDNYIMAVAEDIYSTGQIQGVFKGSQYVITSGFTGVSGNGDAPMNFIFNPGYEALSGRRISGGGAINYGFGINYYTGSNLLTTCYKAYATGAATGAVSGYTGELLADHGILFSGGYGQEHSGTNYIYDNSLSLQSGLYTGEYNSGLSASGTGYSGYYPSGSGAGSYWGDGCPRYDDLMSSSGFAGERVSSRYLYTIFDPVQGTFSCEKEGATAPGIYSMPVDDPNSYDIKYRNGSNFQKSYEQAASYLNSIGEMPAVIINNSQLSKVKELSKVPGWVGLRRGKVGILNGLFSEDYVNQKFFEGENFITGESRDVGILTTSGVSGFSRVEINDIGNNWAWTNGSGTHLYKYAGSGYEKYREVAVDLEVKSTTGSIITGERVTGEVPLMKIDSARVYNRDSSLVFGYSFVDNYYSGFQGNEWTTNYNVTKVNLYTGDNINFEVSNSSLAQTYGSGGIIRSGEDFVAADYQTGITYTPPPDAPASGYYKIVPFDSVGSGYVSNINQLVTGNFPVFTTDDDQLTVVNLDDAYTAGENFVYVNFPKHHSHKPTVTHSLLYTGAGGGTIGYLGAMLSGEPSISGAFYILTDIPAGNDYALYVRSAYLGS